jgi:hypothetical protein
LESVAYCVFTTEAVRRALTKLLTPRTRSGSRRNGFEIVRRRYDLCEVVFIKPQLIAIDAASRIAFVKLHQPSSFLSLALLVYYQSGLIGA